MSYTYALALTCATALFVALLVACDTGGLLIVAPIDGGGGSGGTGGAAAKSP